MYTNNSELNSFDEYEFNQFGDGFFVDFDEIIQNEVPTDNQESIDGIFQTKNSSDSPANASQGIDNNQTNGMTASFNQGVNQINRGFVGDSAKHNMQNTIEYNPNDYTEIKTVHPGNQNPANPDQNPNLFGLNQSANAAFSQTGEQNKALQSANVGDDDSGSLIRQKPSRSSTYGKGPETEKLKAFPHYKEDYSGCSVFKALNLLSPGKIQHIINAIGRDYNNRFYKNAPRDWPKFKREHTRNVGIAIWFFEELLHTEVKNWLISDEHLPLDL